MEQPKQHTPEEMAEIEMSRTKSDASLGDGGAKYKFNEKGEKELHVTEAQIRRAERLGEPFFRFMSKYLDASTIESIVSVAERTNSRSMTEDAVRSKWLPLINQLKNDPEFTKFDNAKDDTYAVTCCLKDALNILSYYDPKEFDELNSRASAVFEKFHKKVPSEGWSWHIE